MYLKFFIYINKEYMFTKNKNNITKRDVFKLFNKNYFELLEFMKLYSNKNPHFNNFYTKNYYMKKANIKIFIKTWNNVIYQKYGVEIMNNNVSFFLEKDFNDELNNATNLNKEYKLDDCIKYMKSIYSTMDKKITDVFIKYIRDLTILTDLYNKTK